MRAYEQPDKAKQTHASEATMMVDIQKTDTLQSIDSLPFGNESPVRGVRGRNMPQKIKIVVVQYSNSYR